MFRSHPKRIIALTLVLIIVSACGRDLPKLEDVNLEQWKQDRNACGNYRAEAQQAVVSQKNKLLALKEMQIVELLGRPDRNELYRRNQKFYYYYLSPAPDCQNYNAATSKRLAIRFNAMGLAKEVMVE